MKCGNFMLLMLKSAFTKKNITKTLAFLGFVVIFAILQKRYSAINPKAIQSLIISYGIYGPMIFFVFSFIRPVIFFPITLIYLSSGLAFGGFWGGIIAILGAIIGAAVAHIIANKVGIDFLPMKWRSRIYAVSDKVNENGLRNMILVRFIPMISFDLISYSAGLSKVKMQPYLLGTLIGVSPRIFAYTFVGSNILSPGKSSFWIALIVLMMIFFIPGLVYKYINRK